MVVAVPSGRESVWLCVGVAVGAVVAALLMPPQSGRRKRRLAVVSEEQRRPALARRVCDCQPLPIKVIAAEVADEIASGRDIVNMSQGVPCLPIFEPSEAAMVKLIHGRSLPYSNVGGMDSVRETCARFVNEAYALPSSAAYGKANVIVTAGGIQACHNVLGLVLEDALDVVVATVPAYPLYQLETTYFGATFAPLAAEGAAPTPQALSAAFATHRREGRQVRAVVICAPNNPTGATLSSAEARALAAALDAEIAREEAETAAFSSRGFVVLLDEVYLGIETSPHVSLLHAASPALRRRICLVLSASKGLGAMPGARAAWVACADPSLVTEMMKIQSCASGNASTIAQVGLEAALRHCMSTPRVLAEVTAYYEARTRAVADGLNALGRKHGLAAPLCALPHATFYVWADLSQVGGVASDTQIFRRLLALGVAVVPGSAFAMAPERKLVRLSCAQDSMGAIERALARVDEALAEWLVPRPPCA